MCISNKSAGDGVQVARPMYKQDIMYMGSVTKLDEYKREPDRETYIRSHTSLPAIDESKHQSCGARLSPAINVIKEMFGVELLKSVMFQVVCVSSFLSMLGFFTPFFFVTSYALSVGIDSGKATMLLSLLGVFNTISRIATGFFSDKPWANPLIIHNVALICAGVATCFAPVYVNFPLLVIYCGIFGCCIGEFSTDICMSWLIDWLTLACAVIVCTTSMYTFSLISSRG
jgi:MCP family monocarboxylic acid transporter-like MFS transporter 14